MRNIWIGKKSKKGNIAIAVSLVFFSMSIALSVIGVNSASNTTIEEEIFEVENAINKVVTLCYAIEGSYPKNIDYLKTYYGLEVDETKYIIHYESFASNIAPEIQVFKIR